MRQNLFGQFFDSSPGSRLALQVAEIVQSVPTSRFFACRVQLVPARGRSRHPEQRRDVHREAVSEFVEKKVPALDLRIY